MYETLKIKLPSNGILGYPAEVTVRNLTGADEKMLYSGSHEVATDKLIKRCIVEPEDFNISDICEQDKYYILLQIRILTYGDEYKFDATCPDCGKKTQTEINLDELEVTYADDTFKEKLELTLPINKSKIKFRMLTSKEVREVNNRLAKVKGDRGTEYILKCASIIQSIDGEDKSLIEKQKFVEDLSSRDINAIWKAYSKINLGVDLKTPMTCPYCQEHNDVQVVMNAEFFRPSFDD
jgi:hypothetical protein